MEGKWNEMLWTRDKIRLLYAARIQVISDDLIFKIMVAFRFEAKNDYENDI